MASNKLYRKSLTQVRELLKQNKISPEELVDVCKNRIRETASLNYFTNEVEHDDPLINSKIDLPLKGIPFSVKDNFNTEDMPTTCASNMLANYVPPYNATIVEKLLAYGGTMMGKDNMDEFAMGSGGCESQFGPVKNPWNHKELQADDDFYVPGGSSGGSAAAVAAGATYFSIGSDTGGSVRVPASFCGVVGLKPTYGAFSRYGLIPLCNSLDVPGIFTRSVQDTAFVFNILKGRDANDPTSIKDHIPDANVKEEESVKGMTIGIPKEHHISGTHPDIRAAWDKAIQQFSDAGANVVEVSLPNQEYVQPTYRILCCADVASNLARYDGVEFGHRARAGDFTEALYTITRDEGFNEKVKRRIVAGNFFLLEENYERFFGKALALRRLIHDDYARVFGKRVSRTKAQTCDVMLTPTTSCTSQLYSRFMTMSDLGSGKDQDHHDLAGVPEMDYHVTAINMAGVPAISVPVGMSNDQYGYKVPIGMQLIAYQKQENVLLKAAKFLEQESNFEYFTDKN